MADIKVSSENLVQTSAQLTSGSGELQTLLGSLNGLVNSMGSEWQGAGSASFGELYSQFHSAGGQLQEALTGISKMLSDAAGYYAESEANVAQAFRR